MDFRLDTVMFYFGLFLASLGAIIGNQFLMFIGILSIFLAYIAIINRD